MGRPVKGTTFHDRVFSQVKKNEQTGCMEFYGNRDQYGYGRIYRDDRLVRIHRSLWEDVHGPIPPKMCVCHHCDNPCCVNIDHLFCGSHGDNMHDMFKKGRRRILRGSQQSQSKLNERMVTQIKKRLLNNDGVRLLAREFNVSHAVISAIKLGKKWNHVQLGDNQI